MGFSRHNTLNMQIDSQLTDETVLREVGRRLERHRLDRNLSQEKLAEEAGVGRRTVQRIEHGGSVQMTSFVRILRTLGLLDGLGTAIPAPLPSPMEQLASRGRQRKRARARRHRDEDDGKPWTWADEPGDSR